MSAPGRVWAIALNTYREAIRQKTLYVVAGFAAGIKLLAVALGEMSLHQEVRVVKDVSLGALSIFGVAVAAFVGGALLYKEIDKKTIFTVLAKPVHRHEFLLGKYVGLGLTLTTLFAALVALLTLALALRGVTLDVTLVKQILLSYSEVLVVAAIATFFSSWASPFAAGLFTVALFVVGRLVPDIAQVAKKVDNPVAHAALKTVARIAPDLHLYAISGGAVDGGKEVSIHASFVGWDYVATAAGYGLLWSAAALLLGILIFRRRDFV